MDDVADIDVSRLKAHFASWNGTAPIDASSGDQNRHRLPRAAGNRRINRALRVMAAVQLRNDTEGRRYYRRKLAMDPVSVRRGGGADRRGGWLIWCWWTKSRLAAQRW